MKNLFIAFAMAIFVSTMAFASVNILSDGTNLGPAQDINITGGTVSGNGPVKTFDVGTFTDDVSITGDVDITGDVTVDDQIYVDGTIYEAFVSIGNLTTGTHIAPSTTLDPCGTLPKHTIFFNSTTGSPCFCNSLGVDLSLYNGTSSCF